MKASTKRKIKSIRKEIKLIRCESDRCKVLIKKIAKTAASMEQTTEKSTLENTLVPYIAYLQGW